MVKTKLKTIASVKNLKKGIFCSWLFIPTLEDRFVNKIHVLNADVFVLDLEDSIHYSLKDNARESLKRIIGKIGNSKNLAIRINNINTPYGLDDLEAAMKLQFKYIVYPKVKDHNELLYVINMINKSKSDNYYPELIPIIETASALANSNRIIQNSTLSDYIIFGSEDFLADFGLLSRNFIFKNPLLVNSITQISIICASYGKYLIDCACPYYYSKNDLLNFNKECQFTLNLGAKGKLAIHPNQLEYINKVYGQITEDKMFSMLYDIKEILTLINKSNKTSLKFNNHLIGIPELRKYFKELQNYNSLSNDNKVYFEEINSLLKNFLNNA